MIEYNKFRMSLKRLEEQYENYRAPDDSLPDLTQEAVAESVIQRFETMRAFVQLRRMLASRAEYPLSLWERARVRVARLTAP